MYTVSLPFSFQRSRSFFLFCSFAQEEDDKLYGDEDASKFRTAKSRLHEWLTRIHLMEEYLPKAPLDELLGKLGGPDVRGMIIVLRVLFSGRNQGTCNARFESNV